MKNKIDFVLCLATFRCFHEQLYNLKGSYSQKLKKDFNKLVSLARKHEKEIIKISGQPEQLEQVYDNLMDIIYEVKEVIQQELENE